MKCRRRCSMGLMTALLLGPLASLHAASNCEDLRTFSVHGTSLAIQKADLVPAGSMSTPPGAPPMSVNVPAHCRVDGVIGAHTGRDGKPYGIHFAIAMPEQWNGRLLYQGGGALNGGVTPPLGATAAGDSPALPRGFAVVSSDSGHQGQVFDASFFADQQ